MTARYIAIVPHAWGSGETASAAMREARRNKPSFVKSNDIDVWQVGPSATVNAFGDIRYDTGDMTPKLVHQLRVVRPSHPVLRGEIPPTGRALTRAERAALAQRRVLVPVRTTVLPAKGCTSNGALYRRTGDGLSALGVGVTLRREAP
jgi:hypothetical protein